jgi:hypothetical protein
MIPVNNAAEQTSHALGPLGRQSSSIGDPGTTFFVNGSEFMQRKKCSDGRPVETAAGMEIDQGGLRQHFLDDFHTCLKKPRTKRFGFFTVTHKPNGGNQPTGIGPSNPNLKNVT